LYDSKKPATEAACPGVLAYVRIKKIRGDQSYSYSSYANQAQQKH
jgi:hypothetical protein